MNLARCNEYMFRKVKCGGYMKPVKDGKFIRPYPETGRIESVEYIHGWDEEKLQDIVTEPEFYDGSEQLVKTYYEFREHSFAGIVVGMKLLDVTRILTADTNVDYRGNDYIYISKQSKEQRKCALVYFGCNKSRYVPLDELEVVDDFE